MFLVEDNPSVRLSICDLLVFAGYQVQCFEAGTHFLDYLAATRWHGRSAPHVLVIDMCIPGLSGVEVQARLHASQHRLGCIFISGESSIEQAVGAMKQGALEFLVKPFEIDVLLGAVGRAMNAERQRLEADSVSSSLQNRLALLSPRERSVCDLMERGRGNAQIAEQLGISVPTVKQHKSQVMGKLQVANLAELLDLLQQTPSVR